MVLTHADLDDELEHYHASAPHGAAAACPPAHQSDFDAVRRGAMAAGVSAGAVGQFAPFVVEMLKKFGPVAVQLLVDWLTKRVPPVTP